VFCGTHQDCNARQPGFFQQKQSTRTGRQTTCAYICLTPGFVEEGNPHDVLMVACPLPPVEQWGEDVHARAALLASRGLTPQLFLPAPQPGDRCPHPTAVLCRLGQPCTRYQRPSGTHAREHLLGMHTCHKVRAKSNTLNRLAKQMRGI
jgi:hypothetical protein